VEGDPLDLHDSEQPARLSAGGTFSSKKGLQTPCA
jgi:hypothetical protein